MEKLVDILILFYINSKHLLKTRQLSGNVMDEMIKYCKANGFNSCNEEEIQSTWENLVAAYMQLKNKDISFEEKQSWKYYEIMDCCFECSDFNEDVSKFSKEMLWFLITCFLKRRERILGNNSVVLSEIHKEFLNAGYIHITRKDITKEWKYLNAKYNKLRDDTEAIIKLPYLQALNVYHDRDSKCLVKMIFTQELTETLINQFNKRKIKCNVHGYESREVLTEIQDEFATIGYECTCEEIGNAWQKLVTIYDFIKNKGRRECSWPHFNAIEKHFDDNFTFEDAATNKITHKQSLRQRSESMSAVTQENYDIPKKNELVHKEWLSEKRLLPKRNSAKRTPCSEPCCMAISTKKQKVILKSKNRTGSTNLKHQRDNNELIMKGAYEANKKQTELECKENNMNTDEPEKLPNHTQRSCERYKNSNPVNGLQTSSHIDNMNRADIAENLTINEPSSSKQFPDDLNNAFLGFPSVQQDEVANGCLRLAGVKTTKLNGIQDECVSDNLRIKRINSCESSTLNSSYQNKINRDAKVRRKGLETKKVKKKAFCEDTSSMSNLKIFENSDSSLPLEQSDESKTEVPVNGNSSLQTSSELDTDFSKPWLVKKRRLSREVIISLQDLNKIHNNIDIKTPSDEDISKISNLGSSSPKIKFKSKIVKSTINDCNGLENNILSPPEMDIQVQNNLQNNLELIEIKNLIKQSNLLHRETNRLLRMLLDRTE